MREIFQNAVRQSRLLHALSFFLATLFCAMLLLFCGEMQGMWGWLSVIGLGLVFVLGTLDAWMVNQYLRPVGELCSLFDSGSVAGEQQLKKVWTLLSNFRRLENRRISIIWMLVGLLLILALELLAGLTLWQAAWLAVAAASGLVVSIILSIGRAGVSFRQLLQALEEKGLERPAAASVSRSVFLWSGLVVFLGTMLMALYNSTSLYRQRLLDGLAAGENSSLPLVLKYAQLRQAHPDWKAEKIFQSVAGEGQYASRLALVDRFGKPLSAFSEDPRWLSRIIKQGAESWRERRAPFLYRLYQAADDGYLIWYSPLQSYAFIFGSGELWLFWLVIMVAGGVLLFSVGGTLRQEVLVMNRQLSTIARGQWDALEKMDSAGLLGPLVLGWRSLARQIRELMKQHQLRLDEIYRESQRLGEAAAEIKAWFEGRTDLTEQTATAIIEMRSAIQSVTEQLDALRQTSSDNSSGVLRLEQSVKEVSKAAENVGSLIEDSASAIVQISVSLEQVVSSVEGLEKMAIENQTNLSVIEKSMNFFEDNARQTDRLAGNVSELAKSGTAAVAESITGIKEIQQVTSEAQEIINRLGRQIETIGKILTVIGDVAEQTNLLSLNAAIIAAAAGEHGKGFAVVADEIKELADRTSSSTKEIAGLIRNIQADSRQAMETIERSSLSVRQGVDQAEKVQRLLGEIQESVLQVNQMSSAVMRSLAEHASVASRMLGATNDISNMVRQIKRAVSEQSQGGSRLRKVSEQMREEAQFMQRAAGEQVRIVEEVAGNMGKIADMISSVGRAMVEQANGVNHVTKVVVKVRDESEGDQQRVRHISQLAESLLKLAGEGRDNFKSAWGM
jgi:methyl-accepting chemotaxis protein